MDGLLKAIDVFNTPVSRRTSRVFVTTTTGDKIEVQGVRFYGTLLHAVAVGRDWQLVKGKYGREGLDITVHSFTVEPKD